MSAATREAARRYIGRDWAPIPAPPHSKKPGRDGWQDERYGLADVDDAWNNGQNIGLLTGEAFGLVGGRGF